MFLETDLVLCIQAFCNWKLCHLLVLLGFPRWPTCMNVWQFCQTSLFSSSLGYSCRILSNLTRWKVLCWDVRPTEQIQAYGDFWGSQWREAVYLRHHMRRVIFPYQVCGLKKEKQRLVSQEKRLWDWFYKIHSKDPYHLFLWKFNQPLGGGVGLKLRRASKFLLSSLGYHGHQSLYLFIYLFIYFFVPRSYRASVTENTWKNFIWNVIHLNQTFYVVFVSFKTIYKTRDDFAKFSRYLSMFPKPIWGLFT